MVKKNIKIKTNFKKFFWFLAEKSFLLSLCLILISLAIGGILFYKYYYLTINKEPIISEISLKLENKSYEDIIGEWEKRKEEFDGADLKNSPNPFWIPVIPAE